MSIDDERELRQRLGAALDTITPRPAPVGAVVRQGKNVMIRRRLSMAAGLAAVAVAALVVPAWLHQQHAGPAAARPLVTDVGPGPHSVAGLIASGIVGSTRWHAIAEKPGRGNQCFQIGELSCGSPLHARGVASLNQGGGVNGVDVIYGAVRRDVARVDIQLSDGQVLLLRPVLAYGVRYVAFGVPAHLAISRATAYSARSELRYAIPFSSQGTAVFINWLRPGQAGQPRATYKIGSGVVDGRAWSESEYVGPWGRCFTGQGQNTYCPDGSGSLVPRGQVTAMLSMPGPAGGPGFYLVAAVPSVDRIVLIWADGRYHAPPPVVRGAGGQKFYALVVSKGQRVVRWAADTSASEQLGTGKGVGHRIN
jgi:hypothetical protein